MRTCLSPVVLFFISECGAWHELECTNSEVKEAFLKLRSYLHSLSWMLFKRHYCLTGTKTSNLIHDRQKEWRFTALGSFVRINYQEWRMSQDKHLYLCFIFFSDIFKVVSYIGAYLTGCFITWSPSISFLLLLHPWLKTCVLPYQAEPTLLFGVYIGYCMYFCCSIYPHSIPPTLWFIQWQRLLSDCQKRGLL